MDRDGLTNILLVSNDAEFYANYFVFERQNRGVDTFTVKCKKSKKNVAKFEF